MFSMEKILGVLAILSLLFGAVWLFLTMYVLHSSEQKHGRVKGWLQFWPFYAEMKINYPASSRAGRLLSLASLILVLPWLAVKTFGGS
ncbi:hypothetical protein GCM10007418_07980 [Halopseudomonas salina]|uniref:Uncharacterized protein n=1 Tax=Halopseudomonas salina TaxID=1323744 RepID=A0ABQ1P4L9_9GAMM|nr:hypothetical protein GCM10007418_07980 [Halopseudomonas salina]